MKRLTAPPAMTTLIEQLEKLPGIGKRSAERIAFHLIKQPPDEAQQLADAIKAFSTDLKVCSVTGHVSESDPCAIVTDPDRDHGLVLVVEQPRDVIALEQSGQWRGSYHVLMGRLAPLEAVSPEELNIDSLLNRIDRGQDPDQPDWPAIREVVLGLSPSFEGDGTTLYLADALEQRGIKLTRLARGLPTGVNLDTVSKAVLADAVHGRRAV